MMKSPLKSIAEVYISVFEKQDGEVLLSTLSPAGLLENNQVEFRAEYLQEQGGISLRQHDIVLRRLSAAFVNYIVSQPPKETAVLANLVVIRIKDKTVNPKYVAFCIEQYLGTLNEQANSGTRFSALNRQILETFEILLPPSSQQEQIGNLWLLTKIKQNLLAQIGEKERLKSNLALKKINKQIKEEK
jgi:restriction endonuclease S subunit